MRTQTFSRVFKTALYQWWFEGNSFQHGAALSYYAVFALSPFAVVALSLASWIYGPAAAKGELANQIERWAGTTIAPAIQSIVKHAHVSGSSETATILSVVVLLVGAIAFFGQLQESLNAVWRVRAAADRTYLQIAQQRLWPFLMMVIAGGLLAASLLLNLALENFHEGVETSSFPGGHVAWKAFTLVGPFVVKVLLFAAIYKSLPDVKVTWNVVWLGAFVTAALFSFGNYLIGLYLAYSTTALTFGAAGSLAIVLLWVYYSSQVVLFGAKMTEAYAAYLGQAREPTRQATHI